MSIVFLRLTVAANAQLQLLTEYVRCTLLLHKNYLYCNILNTICRIEKYKEMFDVLGNPLLFVASYLAYTQEEYSYLQEYFPKLSN